MAFWESLFGNKKRKMIVDLINYNADIIQKQEGRTRVDSEYLAICTILDDLAKRPNGKDGHQVVMDLLAREYSQHHNDVVTYLAVTRSLIKLNPEADAALMQRHKSK